MEEISCCVISSRIYVVGYSLSGDACKESIFHTKEYVVHLDLWTLIENIPRKRYGFLGVLVDGIFHVKIRLKFGKKNGFSLQTYYYMGYMDSYDHNKSTSLKTKTFPPLQPLWKEK